MKRRDFIHTSLLTAAAGSLVAPTILSGCSTEKLEGKTKNIIFMVSDGMSSGTLNMADLLMQRKFGYGSTWIDLYRQNKAKRAFMDTTPGTTIDEETGAVNSLVTDSAAGSSAWGGGKKVPNGALNVNADDTTNTPILQKFQKVGKSVGCVTTVPITHATPAGFSVNMKNRNWQDKIASEYLKLKFDVMMGGGSEYFDGKYREDKTNIFGDFTDNGFQVVRNKSEMELAEAGKPVLGVFHEDGLPYSVDHENDANLKMNVPTLAEMTEKAIGLLSENSNGFVLQVEGGKVDWGAHDNDTVATIYDQISFDMAVKVAVEFAEGRDDTLVVITTDHGNSNPGLIKNDNVDLMFDILQTVKYTNEWVLKDIKLDDNPSKLIERLNYAQGISITDEEAKSVIDAYKINEPGEYSANGLVFQRLAEVQQNYTSVFWSGMTHSSDYVELAMFGEGSDALPAFVYNHELHNYMLAATGLLTV